MEMGWEWTCYDFHICMHLSPIFSFPVTALVFLAFSVLTLSVSMAPCAWCSQAGLGMTTCIW